MYCFGQNVAYYFKMVNYVMNFAPIGFFGAVFSVRDFQELAIILNFRFVFNRYFIPLGGINSCWIYFLKAG
jgi:Na+/H+-dicarboxylate symporter